MTNRILSSKTYGSVIRLAITANPRVRVVRGSVRITFNTEGKAVSQFRCLKKAASRFMYIIVCSDQKHVPLERDLMISLNICNPPVCINPRKATEDIFITIKSYIVLGSANSLIS